MGGSQSEVPNYSSAYRKNDWTKRRSKSLGFNDQNFRTQTGRGRVLAFFSRKIVRIHNFCRLRCNFFLVDVTCSFSLLTHLPHVPHLAHLPCHPAPTTPPVPLSPNQPGSQACIRGGNELFQTIMRVWLEAQTRRLSCFEVAVTSTSPLAKPPPEAALQPYIKLLCSLKSYEALTALTFDNHTGTWSIPCRSSTLCSPDNGPLT